MSPQLAFGAGEFVEAATTEMVGHLHSLIMTKIRAGHREAFQRVTYRAVFLELIRARVIIRSPRS
jgi:hypothetical protein